MATKYNPAIVQRGLVLCIDPANIRSYAGTGNSVFNVITSSVTACTKTAGVGTTVSATSPTTFTSSFGNYINTNLTMSSGTEFTISVWFKRTGTTYWTMLFGNEVWSSSQGFTGRLESATKIVFSAGGDFTGISYDNAALVSGNFNNYTFVKNTSGTNSLIYVNGVQVASGSITNASITKSLLFNSRYANDGSSAGTDAQPSEMSCALVYDRALSFQEVLQNFNAMKGRFGITSAGGTGSTGVGGAQ